MAMNVQIKEELVEIDAEISTICPTQEDSAVTMTEGHTDNQVSKRIIEIDNEGNVRVMLRMETRKESSNKEAKEGDEKQIQDEPSSTSARKSKRPRFLCPVCKKRGIVTAFKSNATLSIHVQKIHIAQEHVEDVQVETKPVYQCSICKEGGISNVQFESKSKYQNHLVIQHHTYIFICAICSDSFKLKANYKAHLLSHNLPRVKPFQCEVCDGRFVNRAGFESHQRRFPGPHSKHTCPHCGISFSKPNHIINHRCKHLLIEQAKKRASAKQECLMAPTDDDEQEAYSPVAVELDANSSTLDKVDMLEVKEEDGELESRVSGQLVQIGVSPNQQIYQMNVADWTAVAPYIIRDNVNVTIQPSTAIYSQSP